jgi:hypothetical protein
MGVRNKRLPTPRDMRAPTVAEGLEEAYDDDCLGCAHCEAPDCDGVGAVAFCETA